MKLLESHPDFRIVLYLEKGWGYHQDVTACMKDTHFKDNFFLGKYDHK
jgi:hypothetical protein